VVVVVDVVAAEERTGVGARRADAAAGTRAVLRRGSVVVVLAVGGDAGLVVVPLRVLDDEMAARVRARVPEGGVLGVRIVHHRVAVRTGAHVVARVAHVAPYVCSKSPGPRALLEKMPYSPRCPWSS